MAALVPVWRDPAVYGEPHTAEVHPDQLDRWLARGWIQGDAPVMPDPAASPVFQCITGLLNTAWNPPDVRPDRAATEGQLAGLAAIVESLDAKLSGFFLLRGANKDNVQVAAGARVNTQIQVLKEGEPYQIVAFKRVFIENASTSGANRDKIALQSPSTGGGGKQAQIALLNTGTDAARIRISVECLCFSGVLA